MQTIRAQNSDENSPYGTNKQTRVVESVWHRQNSSSQITLEQVDERLCVSKINCKNRTKIIQNNGT